MVKFFFHFPRVHLPFHTVPSVSVLGASGTVEGGSVAWKGNSWSCVHIKLFAAVLNRELAMVPAGDESIVNSVCEKPTATEGIA